MLVNFPLLTTTAPGFVRVSIYGNVGREATTPQLTFIDGISGDQVSLPFAFQKPSGNLLVTELAVYAGAGAVSLTANDGGNFWVEVEQPS